MNKKLFDRLVESMKQASEQKLSLPEELIQVGDRIKARDKRIAEYRNAKP